MLPLAKRNFKQGVFYFSWGLLLVISAFRYEVWHIWDRNLYCSENRLLAYARASLKPENWLAIGVLIFSVVAVIRLYNFADGRWLWFSHYGRIVALGIIFLGLYLLSWSCNGI